MFIVKGFANVLPEDLLGLPPNRDVELTIALVLETKHIPKAPY